MKKTEKDYEYLDSETSPEAKAAGLRRITRPKFLDKIPKNASLRDCKSRITIYLDADIVDFFKKAAEGGGSSGYQTLINQTLRGVVDGTSARREGAVLTEDKLFEKDFLSKLKAELETV